MSEEGLVGCRARVRVRWRKEVTAGHQWAWLLKKTETKTPSPCAVSGRAGADAGLSPRPANPRVGWNCAGKRCQTPDTHPAFSTE